MKSIIDDSKETTKAGATTNYPSNVPSETNDNQPGGVIGVLNPTVDESTTEHIFKDPESERLSTKTGEDIPESTLAPENSTAGYSTMLFTKPTRPVTKAEDSNSIDEGSYFANGNKKLHELVDDALLKAGLPTIIGMGFLILILAGVICKLTCSIQKKEQIAISSI